MADHIAPAGSAAAAAATAANYKKLKEEFVSNLSGGSAGEVLLVTLVAPVAVLAWSILQRRQSFFRPYTPLGFAVDFLLNIGAFLLAVTIYSGQPLLLNALILSQTFFVLALPKNVGQAHPRRVAKKPKKPLEAPTASADSASSPSSTNASSLSVLPKKPFLTTYRACMMVATCVAILAVDFRIFPRRFAKVETWGTSLMDMGVGSFVFSAGVVAARPTLKERINGRGPSLVQRLLTSLRHSLPLLVLGFIRLLSVKGLDYAEHVSEYGVHWNFFFTLGFLPPFVAVAQSALSIVPSYAALALLLSGTYETALNYTALKAYVLTAPRVDLLSMNREGVFSFIGYLALFLAGQDAGLYLLPRDKKVATADSKSGAGSTRPSGPFDLRDLGSVKTQALWSVIWLVLYQLSVSYSYGLGLTVSRRLANLPYVLWVLHFNSIQLLCFYLIDRVVFPTFYSAKDAREENTAYEEATSPILRAYNRNGLAIFLVANLLTGLVNMTVPTLDVSSSVSTGILIAYAGVLTVLAVALDLYNITIKL